MKVFITGTAGFIGFHLAKRLLKEGHRVTGLDGMTPYYDVTLKQRRHAILEAYDGFTPIIAQLEDADALHAAARAAEPEIIVHLAAQAGVRYSIENPKAYLDANLVGSWNVLEAARALHPRHLLMASTSSVYGANETVPFAETDPADRPMTFYAATKKAMEGMAHAYAHIHAIPITGFRFFTVYGPWGRPDMALFKFVDAALNGRPIDVYGEGRMARDFTYVDDLVEAICRLIPLAPSEENRVTAPGVSDTLSPTAPYRVLNLGGGRPTGLLDFIETVERALGQPIAKRMLPMQPGDMQRTYAGADLLHALTGYVPGTPLEAGVEAFVAWYRDHYAQPLRKAG